MAPRTLRSALSAAALAAALLTVAAGCVVAPTEPPAGSSTVDPGDSRAQLGKLKVAKAGSMRGYSRAKFPSWRSTGANCDVRDSVLARDGTKVKTSGCNVVAGTWRSVYDNKTLDTPTKVDVDHVVPLANAWRSGASAWTTDRREDFANDLDRPQLIAVSQTSNRAKGDQDPSTWKPSATGSWCEYAVDWITVKSYWKLTVTSTEKAALTDMLEKC
ncbi:HNH endonuclease family protein [Jidongwangia harbinensis]|uniref:HNH endonuclease family protein n=1 Tax=Jidongwangia harbinensis TaxID=2878561 RepID=UPI001CDA1536|nr:HNH endonuclease family protein [Jidongwangia harbinensis]MCA2215795.1 HNH endonuclease family protein [Jidongwangia harbinensis]